MELETVRGQLNFLAITNFPVIAEWHSSKNAGIDPEEVHSGSHTVYWWLCELHHEWESSPERRIRNGNNCPFCANRKVWAGFNDLESQFPNLVTEWGSQNELSPREVLSTSKSMFSWECIEGHDWMDSPRSRTVLEKSCPFCKGDRVWKGCNDLKSLHPDVARLWATVNAKPADEVLVVASLVSYFRCEIGHEWSCFLYIQIREKTCPFCSDRLVHADFNSLRVLHPIIASELNLKEHPHQNASEILGRGNKLIFHWICKDGHAESRPVEFRVQIGCWECYKNKAKGEPISISQIPFLDSSWDKFKNSQDAAQVPVSVREKLWWICKLGHNWEANPWVRLSRWQECPVCSNKVVLSGFNDLATLRPDLSEEWDYSVNAFLPSEVGVGSNAYAGFKCLHGHTWQAMINNRTRGRNGGTDCPYCANREIWVGFNDLCSTHPDLALELHPTANRDRTCKDFLFGQVEKVHWTCLLGHDWDVAPRFRMQGSQKNGCPYCGSQKLLFGFNDLASVRPDLRREWDFERNFPATPEQVIRGSRNSYFWSCSRDHSYSATVAGRSSAVIGCSQCLQLESHAKYLERLQSRRGLLETEWDEVANGRGLEGALSQEGKAGLFVWNCAACGVAFTQGMNKRVNGQGCPYCANLKIKPGLNDLATKNPELASQWDFQKNQPLLPSQVPVSTAKRVWWNCIKGHSFRASVAHRSAGRGCAACSSGGYNPTKDGWMYLMIHEEWNLLQIGISNVIENRLASHKKNGWQVRDVKGPLDGYWVMDMETDILHTLKSQGVDVGTHPVGKFDGFTESWTATNWPSSSLQELFSHVYQTQWMERCD